MNESIGFGFNETIGVGFSDNNNYGDSAQINVSYGEDRPYDQQTITEQMY
jgi:hypothetical protein